MDKKKAKAFAVLIGDAVTVRDPETDGEWWVGITDSRLCKTDVECLTELADQLDYYLVSQDDGP